MSINELTSEDPMLAPHPDMASSELRLFPHQLTMVHRMLELEKNRSIDIVTENVANALSNAVPNGYAFTYSTRIGIIADKVGAGKSYEILALVLQDALLRSTESSPSPSSQVSFCNDRLVLSYKLVTPPTSSLTVIVVHHALVHQWIQYATRLIGTKLRAAAVYRKRHLPIDLDNLDLLIVSTTFHNDIALQLRDRTVRRVVYDEADNVRIVNCRTISASFYWFATASYQNLFDGRVRSSGFIWKTFHDLDSSNIPRFMSRMLVLKNRDSYVNASLNVPPIVNHVRMCKSPVAVSVLRGMVGRVVLECLNAGDVAGAIQHLAPSHRQPETNIISILVERLSSRLHNLKIRTEQLGTMIFDSPEEKQEEETRLKEQVQSVERQIASIQRRIQECDSCCICFNTITNKTISPCCSNAYCFACISRWTAQKPSCPLCKSELSTQRLYVVSDEGGASTSAAAAAAAAEAEEPQGPQLTKLEQLEAVLRERARDFEGGRILLCSGFENTFTTGIIPMLDRMGITHRFLKGTQDTTASIIRDFKAGRVRVLLVNPNNYGSGLNCEMTTDVILMHKFRSEVEKQVVGRAQRVGRTAPLNVWSILYENEA